MGYGQSKEKKNFDPRRAPGRRPPHHVAVGVHRLCGPRAPVPPYQPRFPSRRHGSLLKEKVPWISKNVKNKTRRFAAALAPLHALGAAAGAPCPMGSFWGAGCNRKVIWPPTTSPSSLTNRPMFGFGRISSTLSDGPAGPDAFRRLDDRAIDQDRMRHHEIDQLLVRPFGIAEAEFGVRGALFPQERADRNPHRRDQLLEALSARRVLEIFDDGRLFRRSSGSSPARCATCRMRDCGRS